MVDWFDTQPEVPHGKWFKRFSGMIVCGEGELVKPSSYLARSQWEKKSSNHRNHGSILPVSTRCLFQPPSRHASRESSDRIP